MQVLSCCIQARTLTTAESAVDDDDDDDSRQGSE